MKILALRLSQLASLPGPVTLDFSAEPLVDAGLFAITGPTGAGKSTLLDALCLALYGNTPRLRHAPSRESRLIDVDGSPLQTSDPRTLLRRGAASGHAEVDFIGRDGRRYRARWAVRRARDKADGKLQAVEQSLTDLDDERLLTAQKREFAELLPERLGLTFDQFTRAVMLAQSEFAAFLKADDNERADLLEKLTDTFEYSAISRAAFEKDKIARADVARLEARLADDAPADAEARAGLDRAYAEAEARLSRCRQEGEALAAERQWLERDARLGQAAQAAADRNRKAHHHWSMLADERRDLEWLGVLAPQIGNLKRHTELGQRKPELEQRQASTRQALADAKQQLALQQQAEALAISALEQHALAIEQARPALRDARDLATQLATLDHQLEQLARDSEERGAQAVARKKQRQAAEARQRDHQHQRDAAQAELAQQLGEHSDIEAARRSAQQRHDQASRRVLALAELDGYWRRDVQARRRLTALEAEQQRDRSERDRLLEQGKTARQELDRIDAHRVSVTGVIEAQRAARSESVHRLRDDLRPDTPCPVCGGVDHPYRHRHPATPEAAQLAATEAAEQRQLDEASAAANQARETRDTLLGSYRALAATVTQRDAQLSAAQTERTESGSALAGHALYAELNAVGGGDDARQDWLDQQRHQAEQHRDASQRSLAALGDAERRLAPLADALVEDGRILERLATQEQANDEERQRLEAARSPLSARVDALRQDLAQRLGPYASVDSWQHQLETQRDAARLTRDEASEARQQAQQHGDRLAQRLAHDDDSLTALDGELANLTATLAAWRSRHPSLDDSTLTRLTALSDDHRSAMVQRCTHAERERHAADISHAERLEQWRDARRERFPDEVTGTTPEDLARLDAAETGDNQPAYSEASGSVEAAIETMREGLPEREAAHRPRWDDAQRHRDGALHALRDDDRRLARHAEAREALEQARGELHRWGRINELIGASDGKLFRRIAQAWNLERLLIEANAHLKGLSRRYRLARGGSPLGLLVIDRDLADEKRSVHSLSGGETFLVSLAMALGLASLASGELAIESLFIDEGFGSLDPQSLALAMEALDGLQAQGRRVAVISHVQEMHERIPVQVQVRPAGNGESRVEVRG
ncbi:AAA family ATPase [Halomonas sp. V046]|uniref:AAA family ATPase n=1 Tax=Halomonas sp. V046 TaxID=3459611 RepID=UPI004044BA80